MIQVKESQYYHSLDIITPVAYTSICLAILSISHLCVRQKNISCRPFHYGRTTSFLYPIPFHVLPAYCWRGPHHPSPPPRGRLKPSRPTTIPSRLHFVRLGHYSILATTTLALALSPPLPYPHSITVTPSPSLPPTLNYDVVSKWRRGGSGTVS